MDQNRGRSPSAGRANASNRQSRSPSAQPAFNQQASARGVDPTFSQSTALSHSFDDSPAVHQGAFTDASSFIPADQFNSDQSHNAFLQDPNHVAAQAQYTNDYSFQDTTGTQPFDGQSAFEVSDVNPDLLHSGNGNIDPSFDDFFFDASAQESDQPHMQVNQTMGGFNNGQTSMAQPSMLNNMSFPSDNSQYGQQFQQPHTNHSRHTSLSPSSALTNEWSGIAFNGHRRNPSDAVSDVSSQHSPFVEALEQPEHINGTSPLFNTQIDPVLPDTLGQFSLSDNQYHPTSRRASPAHSSHGSPHISPQSHQLSQFERNDQFGMLASDRHFNGGPGPQMYPNHGQGPEAFPGMSFNLDQINGHAIHMDTPEISIEFAPTRQGTFDEARQPGDIDNLIPPGRTPSRQRGRAVSDPYSPGSMSRGDSANRSRAPSLGLPANHNHSRNFSRSTSPSGPANGIQKSRDRAASTSSIENRRDLSASLGDPSGQADMSLLSSSPASNASDYSGANKRTQKHPATFKCPQCPKKFTRAYNLRSHLRTHTDERPFVCTVCGKAFARQHDRKRHEGLHSGEKKFVCRGLLAGGAGGTWGCGRRFARADALGRHFRSEAGRACIKPLLDEEARGRRAAQIEQHNQEMLNAHPDVQAQMQQQHMGMPPMPDVPLDVSGITLPAALLAQYPALAGIWDTMPADGSGPADDGDFDFEHSGRSSFEASSGGELDFDDEGLDGGFGVQGGGEWGVQGQMMGQASGGQEWR